MPDETCVRHGHGAVVHASAERKSSPARLGAAKDTVARLTVRQGAHIALADAAEAHGTVYAYACLDGSVLRDEPDLFEIELRHEHHAGQTHGSCDPGAVETVYAETHTAPKGRFRQGTAQRMHEAEILDHDGVGTLPGGIYGAVNRLREAVVRDEFSHRHDGLTAAHAAVSPEEKPSSFRPVSEAPKPICIISAPFCTAAMTASALPAGDNSCSIIWFVRSVCLWLH